MCGRFAVHLSPDEIGSLYDAAQPALPLDLPARDNGAPAQDFAACRLDAAGCRSSRGGAGDGCRRGPRTWESVRG